MPRKKKEETVTTKTTAAPKEEKVSKEDKAYVAMMDGIEKNYGKGALWVGNKVLSDTRFFSSGCANIDKVLGGGWAQGRVVEVFGPESSGKTTLALHAIAEMQKQGKRAAFVDVEHALDPHYAEALGIDMEKLLISQPDSAEQALNIILKMAESGAVSLIVVDSVAALLPEQEKEKDIGASSMGKHALLMSQSMRKLCGPAYKNKCTVLFINQIRMKIGVMFGNPETTTGGNALKFYSSQRVDVRRIGGVKEGTGDDAEFVANKTRVKCVKNKVSPPFREAEVQIRYGEGIDIWADLLEIAVEAGAVKKAGAWYSDPDTETNFGQGAPAARQYLIDNPEFTKKVRSKL